MASRFSEPSVDLHDLIKKSELISEGPPQRRRLLTTRSNLGEDNSVRKWTFGQREVNMQNKILLMVGETGAGKTTLINAMTNYILGVKFTDEVWFEIKEVEENNDKSKTQEVTMYEVFAQNNPICLTIIDTPGYGDTRGTDEDIKVAEYLNKLFNSDSGVKEIDAVCLLMKASENKLSDRQQYIFYAVLSLFGKDIENNIVMFITHSDGLPPTNVLNVIKKAGIPCRKNKQNQPKHFLFNNRQTEERRPEYNETLQTAWDLTADSLKMFFTSPNEQKQKRLEQTKGVLNESKQLVACIYNLQNCIEVTECKGKELNEIQKALEEDQEKINRNENFTFTVKINCKEKVPTDDASWWNRMVTSCSVCEENCHEYNCRNVWNSTV
ncbi:hypothetical protein Q7C36_004248 [Tachysurus vachellii]|uniref:AIG1-type G domain-containing protein n=1 Tax=Tachysurus vachellii TaxID=175792 RepID=A0AA88NP16_TACVA|nr:hypothetical protein Q7C36_004248 [Tachysurus vachellii]